MEPVPVIPKDQAATSSRVNQASKNQSSYKIGDINSGFLRMASTFGNIFTAVFSGYSPLFSSICGGVGVKNFKRDRWHLWEHYVGLCGNLAPR
jgi:hypothetical protein